MASIFAEIFKMTVQIFLHRSVIDNLEDFINMQISRQTWNQIAKIFLHVKKGAEMG